VRIAHPLLLILRPQQNAPTLKSMFPVFLSNLEYVREGESKLISIEKAQISEIVVRSQHARGHQKAMLLLDRKEMKLTYRHEWTPNGTQVLCLLHLILENIQSMDNKMKKTKKEDEEAKNAN
jgi:hypothetical protein